MRVKRAFAFIDVAGFTSLTAQEGDERAVRLLTLFRTRLREMCSRRGVRIAKWLGDGAMLVSVEPVQLVATTLEAHFHMANRPAPQDPVDIRTGISVGEVILMEGDDYIGHAVNVAARLCDAAKPGWVLATEAVLPSVPKWGVCVGTEQTDLRGLERPLAISRLSYRLPDDGGQPDPVCGLPLSPATAELSALDALGRPVLFCSDSCHDTWANRPEPLVDDLGSPRQPLIGT